MVFIEIDATKVFLLQGVYFTDGNVASSKTQYYTKIADLDKLDWKTIGSPNKYGCSPVYDREWKRKKASEVLVPNSIPVDFFKRVIVYCQETADNLASKAKKQRLKIDVDPTLYL